jgi:hypothetical protein
LSVNGLVDGACKKIGAEGLTGWGDCGDFETGIKCSINFYIACIIIYLGVIKQSFECSKFAAGEGVIVQAPLRLITPHDLQGNYFESVAAMKS